MMLFALVASAFLFSLSTAQQICNGYPQLCAKPYNQYAQIATHNSFAFGKNIAANQNFDIPTQLKDGVRALMLDAHKPPAANATNLIELCHTSCSLLDAGSLGDTLKQINAFLRSNPGEVVTILWENFDKLPAATFAAVYKASGVLDLVYTRTANDKNWPTLGELVSTNKRLINFIDVGTDPSQPWLLDHFTYIYETPFEVPSPDQFKCVVDRPKTGKRGDMYNLNHFIYGTFLGNNEIKIPQRGAAAVTNTQSLASHINNCRATFGAIPNFITVDFYEEGGGAAFQLAAQLNGVTYTPRPLGALNNGSGPTAKQNGIKFGSGSSGLSAWTAFSLWASLSMISYCILQLF
ncbi:uncharacterized protein VTP21DRAFT_2078 [Calcarisporiella thermophila]|uniref:uncharacterized protein n=1 Tax=Calcarisporiella thermophila TaxID=911321 RepID=UPI00374490D4